VANLNDRVLEPTVILPAVAVEPLQHPPVAVGRLAGTAGERGLQCLRHDGQRLRPAAHLLVVPQDRELVVGCRWWVVVVLLVVGEQLEHPRFDVCDLDVVERFAVSAHGRFPLPGLGRV